MKGMMGIGIAVALGLTGAVCNWYYMAKQASGYETESFVIVNAQLNPGDKFKSEHFQRVDIPKKHVGNLTETAIPFALRETAVNYAAIRAFQGGEILLRQDLKALPAKDLKDMLSKDEIAYAVPVDPRTFVSDNFNPGDMISFLVPQYIMAGEPTVAGSSGDTSRSVRLIGPFRILALGGRKGSSEVASAAGVRSREDVLTVAVNMKEGEDGNAKALFSMLAMTGGKGVNVVKLPDKK